MKKHDYKLIFLKQNNRFQINSNNENNNFNGRQCKCVKGHDNKCYNAKTPASKCKCRCGGMNHGIAHKYQLDFINERGVK